MIGVDSQTGRLLWEFSFPHVGNDQNMPTPTFHQGYILLGGENRGLHRLDPQRKDGKWAVKEAWYQPKVALDMSTAVINGDLLYGFSHYGKGRLFCLDPNTGEILWQGPDRTGDNVMLLSITGHIVALIDNGELQVVAATGDEFEKVMSYQVSESPTWAPPVLLENGMLVKDQTSLSRWSFPMPTDPPAMPVSKR